MKTSFAPLKKNRGLLLSPTGSTTCLHIYFDQVLNSLSDALEWQHLTNAGKWTEPFYYLVMLLTFDKFTLTNNWSTSLVHLAGGEVYIQGKWPTLLCLASVSVQRSNWTHNDFFPPRDTILVSRGLHPSIFRHECTRKRLKIRDNEIPSHTAMLTRSPLHSIARRSSISSFSPTLSKASCCSSRDFSSWRTYSEVSWSS